MIDINWCLIGPWSWHADVNEEIAEMKRTATAAITSTSGSPMGHYYQQQQHNDPTTVNWEEEEEDEEQESGMAISGRKTTAVEAATATAGEERRTSSGSTSAGVGGDSNSIVKCIAFYPYTVSPSVRFFYFFFLN